MERKCSCLPCVSPYWEWGKRGSLSITFTGLLMTWSFNNSHCLFTRRSWLRIDQVFYCFGFFQAYFLKILKTSFKKLDAFTCLLPFCEKMYSFCLQAIVTCMTLQKNNKCLWESFVWKWSKVPRYISTLTHSWSAVWSCREDCNH